MHINKQVISHSYAMHQGDMPDSELNYTKLNQ